MRLKAMLSALLILLCSARSYAATEDRAYFPPVLIYHDIKARPVMEGFDVSLAEFRYHLDWLKSHGWRTLSAEEFLGYLERREPFPKKTMLITFDDAYGGIVRYAAPELEARGMTAVFFVIVNSIDKTLSRDYWHASAEELQKISAANFSIGSHTLSHPRLNQLSDEELQKELAESKAALENLIGRSIKLIAYPYGDYDRNVIDGVSDAGYKAAFIVDVLDSGTFDRAARWSIPRINMGVMIGAYGHRRFKSFMHHYGRMSDEEFAERWARLPH